MQNIKKLEVSLLMLKKYHIVLHLESSKTKNLCVLGHELRHAHEHTKWTQHQRRFYESITFPCVYIYIIKIYFEDEVP